MSKKTLLISFVLILLVTFWDSSALNTPSQAVVEVAEEQVSENVVDDTDADDGFTISAYDDLMQRIGEEEGQDWLLMSSIAYNESRFQNDLVSRSGAIGIMQIMPIVGKQFNVSKEDIAEPETNIRLAVMLLEKLEAMLKMPASTPQSDRISIILASYNGGIGHVFDARRLARNNGENPNSWEVVARYLRAKADPAVYESELVRNGRFTGSKQTEAYVKNVMSRYDYYRKMARNI
ncbi:MAG: transglycosylase SLT domain-containing protein [Alistipes sp.]|nr:transglycosylase SLT domain-containing protein [Alistipes sp.]